MAAVLECRAISKVYGTGVPAELVLQGVTFSVAEWQACALIGPSGSGKTTLLSILGCLLSPSSGVMKVGDRVVDHGSRQALGELRRRKIGFVFQSYQLIQTLTALENVLLPHELNIDGNGLAKARALLSSVGLEERMDHYPVQLSGGEQQRVALARALVAAPAILVADEPTGNLDEATGRQIIDLMFARYSERDMTLVLVTHDPSLAARCDRVIRLHDGRVEVNPAPACDVLVMQEHG